LYEGYGRVVKKLVELGQADSHLTLYLEELLGMLFTAQ
jgi:hypothetical protein